MNQDQLLNSLKDIILDEDRSISQSIKSDLDKLQHKIEDEAEFKKLVHPQLDSYTSHLKTNFVKIYGNEITGAIKQQIRDSKDEVIDALYPIIGKLIQKYIQSEFAKISEKVDSQVNNTLSPQYWINLIKSKVSGTSNTDLAIRDMSKATLEEIYLIEKDSGILQGSYSKNNTLDQDMIAGMLTAIKSFVEDAFTKKSEELSTIEYNNYKIVFFNYHTFYLALVLSGNITHNQKSEIFEWCNEFVANDMKNVEIDSNSDSFVIISTKLKNYFSQK
jgi:hypothetical protein